MLQRHIKYRNNVFPIFFCDFGLWCQRKFFIVSAHLIARYPFGKSYFLRTYCFRKFTPLILFTETYNNKMHKGCICNHINYVILFFV